MCTLFVYYVILMGGFGSMAATNKIIQVKTVEEALSYFEKATPDTIICFDMDNTLIMPKDPAFRRGIYHKSPELYAYKATLPKPELRLREWA